MKLYKLSAFMFSALLLASCSDIDNQEYDGGAISGDQSQQTNVAIPTRTKATFAGMFTLVGAPCHNYGTHFSSMRPDDFGFVMSAISLDLEGADMAMQDNGYNWFAVASELSSRNANYANPYVRYVIPYTALGIANDIINAFPEDTQDADAVNMIAQSKAMRAFCYLSLAPYFQGSYQTSKDKPCVPLLDGKNDYDNNPRATVEEVYAAIIEDLTYAVKENEIDIAVLTIPKASALEVAEQLARQDIKGIWNFAHIDLNLPKEIQVENVHLSDSLMKLTYNINRYETEKEE